MFERLLCIFVAFLSFLGVVFSSSNMDVTTDASKAIGMSNYVDVYFTNVSSSNGSKVSVSSTGRGLNLEDISLSKANETEIITYTIKNNSYNYDVMVDVTVNGEHHFEDEYFIMDVSEIGKMNSGEEVTGTIQITLKKYVLEEVNTPFEIQLNIQPIQKEYLG